MKKIFAVFFLLMALFVNVALAANGSSTPARTVAVNSTASVVDNANLLTQLQRQQLAATLQKVDQKYGVRLLVYTDRRIQGGVARDYARTAVDKTLANQKAVICVITMSDRQWYIAANKKMCDYAITQDFGIDYISNDMVPYLKKGQYSMAFNTYSMKVSSLLAYAQKNGHPHRASDDFNMEAAVAALVIALIIAFRVRKYLISTMSNVRPALEAGQYLLRDTFQLEYEDDTYLYTDTTVVPKSKRSHGGGGDGGSGGSGGGGSF